LRYFFHISFSGTHYRGWQRQASAVNVQQVLENALEQILKLPITITGCGRTDAGVHASQFFFHADIEQSWDFDLQFRLNKVLPDDIAIFEILPMQGEPHARFDATARTYDYFIHAYKDPFLSSISALYLERGLALDRMKDAMALLTRYNDYAAFCKTPANYRTTICNVSSAVLFADSSGDRMRFQITANRFLGKMVRIIVGTIIDVGRGRLEPGAVYRGLSTGDRRVLGITAPPDGLYLAKLVLDDEGQGKWPDHLSVR